MGRRMDLRCRDPVSLSSYCADPSILKSFCHKSVISIGKTHDSRRAILGHSIYLALAHEIRTLGNYLPQKVSPAHKKHYILQFSSN